MNWLPTVRRLVVCLALSTVLVGCVSSSASIEDRAEKLLASGDYRGAIHLIEKSPPTAESRFALGLLYAFRELAEKSERPDFTRAVELIRSASSEVEEARTFISDYEARGDQVFYAFPWAHMVGPFPEMKRPEKANQPNQALQTTSVTRSGFGKDSVSDRQRRGV